MIANMAKRRETQISTALRKLITAQPFLPFDIKTSQDGTFHVFHPDYCMISPTGKTAVIYEREDDGPTFVNTRQIVSMEPQRPRKGRIGGSRKN
jgi:hypothetical protein